MKERLNASLSCIRWQQVFFNTSVWSHLQVKGDTMCEYRWVIAQRDYEVEQLFYYSLSLYIFTLTLAWHPNTNNLRLLETPPCHFLSPYYQDRHYAALTCLWWSRVVFRCAVWSELTIKDTTITRYRYNFGTGKDEVSYGDKILIWYIKTDLKTILSSRQLWTQWGWAMLSMQ